MRKPFTPALVGASLAVVVLLGQAGPARSEDEGAPRTDQEYLVKAIAMETAEVTIADLAAKGANNEGVRQLAKEISDDHTKARDALAQQAKDLKVGIVAGLTKDHRAKVAKLRLLTGNEFDKAFLQHVIDSHTSGEKVYSGWSASTKDAGLKKMATQYHESAKGHLKKAKDLQKKLGE